MINYEHNKNSVYKIDNSVKKINKIKRLMSNHFYFVQAKNKLQ